MPLLWSYSPHQSLIIVEVSLSELVIVGEMKFLSELRSDMRISVELPDTAAFVQLDQDYLKEALVATLYHLGKLSEKEACTALGFPVAPSRSCCPGSGFPS